MLKFNKFKTTVRRAMKRLIQPLFGRHIELLYRNEQRVENLERAQVELAEIAQKGLALGWDHTALVRRLAALEDQVEALASQRDHEHHAANTVSMSHARAKPATDNFAAKVG
jgi:hypothetical protein